MISSRRHRRALFVTTSLGRGGAEKQLALLARGFARERWDVTIVSLLPVTAHAKEMAEAGVRIRELRLERSALSLAKTFWQLRSVMRDVRPDCVITFNFHANVLGRICSRSLGIRNVISSIRSPHFGGRSRDWSERATVRLARIVTTNSSRAAAELRRRHVVPSRMPLHVIPNMLPPSAGGQVERQKFRSALGLKDEFMWVAVGRLEEPKGYPLLVDAFTQIADEKTVLVIAGKGTLETSIRARLRQHPRVRVLLIGEQEEVDSLLAAADAYVLASLWEGLPNALMEAMQAGLPIVATGVGGVPELLEHSVSGLSVPPRDARALAAAMRSIQEMSAADRKRLGETARAKVEENHDEQRILRRWLSLTEGGGLS